MTDSFQAQKGVMHFLIQARAMRSALVERLYCAVCAVFMGVLSTLRGPSSKLPVSSFRSWKFLCPSLQPSRLRPSTGWRRLHLHPNGSKATWPDVASDDFDVLCNQGSTIASSHYYRCRLMFGELMSTDITGIVGFGIIFAGLR